MPAHPPRILIVDDEGSLLRSLQRAVADCGMDVDTASDGLSAWERIRHHRYDLVVTDLRMPQMEGSELLAHIRDEGVGTRVVVITGHATLDAAVDCLRKGAVDFLVKPFTMETFLDSISRVLDRPAATPHAVEPDWDRVIRELGLTQRQGEILAAFYRTGRSNRELGTDFCLSPYTIKSHLRVAFQRAGVSTRTQLLRRLRQFRT